MSVQMFEEPFAKQPKVLLLKNQNTTVLQTYSKRIDFTFHEWGMPFGRKKLSSLAPSNSIEEVSFVRGLFDTDGCVYRKYGPYMQIQFKFATPDLLTYLKQCLEKLGFHPTSIKMMKQSSDSTSADKPR
jgi:LAGLIDADG-like domain